MYVWGGGGGVGEGGPLRTRTTPHTLAPPILSHPPDTNHTQPPRLTPPLPPSHTHKQPPAGEKLTSDANMGELGKRLLKKTGLPEFKPVTLTLEMLVAEGERLEREQTMVNSHNLAKEYLKPQKKFGGRSLIGLQG